MEPCHLNLMVGPTHAGSVVRRIMEGYYGKETMTTAQRDVIQGYSFAVRELATAVRHIHILDIKGKLEFIDDEGFSLELNIKTKQIVRSKDEAAPSDPDAASAATSQEET